MSDLGLSDLLTLAQTAAILSALVVTLYFSRKQMRAFETDLEARVLNDLDEKFHRIGEIFIERPELVQTLYRSDVTLDPEVPVAYYILFFCAHIFRMRQRGILRDNEWSGWLAWMQNGFRFGRLGHIWVDTGMSGWFDPEFRAFVERTLLPERGAAAQAAGGGGSPAGPVGGPSSTR